MGVVRQEVKTLAGNSWLCGRVSCASHAASRIQSLGEVPEEEELEGVQSRRYIHINDIQAFSQTIITMLSRNK